MKRKKNKALKQKVSNITRRVGRQKVFKLPSVIKKILGFVFVSLAIILFMFPLYSLCLLAIGLLFLHGPLYTEKKVLRVVHIFRYIKKKIINLF